MSSLTEQFSAVTKSQLEAQFKIFNTFASTAVDSAEKVIALNLNTTKASVEKSSATARKLLEAKDAQELFSLNAAQPSGFDNLLAYGRQLYNIATAAQTELLQSAQSGIKQAQEQAQELAKAVPLAAVTKAAQPVAPVVEVAPAPGPAAPPPTLAAAVSAAVATPDNAPVIAEASTASANEPVAAPPQKAAKAPVKPKPAAAPIEPPAAVEVKAEVKPDPVKSSFPAPAQKPIALAPEAKPSKLKEVAPKAKPAPGKPLDMISGGKGKK